MADGRALLAAAAESKPDVVIRLGVIKDELKWDKAALSVGAGQLVELQIVNTDAMPHNFILGTQGSLEAIGKAADAMLTSPTGQIQQFVPDIPQVLTSTRLIEPGQSFTIQFRVRIN